MRSTGREYHDRRPFTAYCHDCGWPLVRGQGVYAERSGRWRVVCRDREECATRVKGNERPL